MSLRYQSAIIGAAFVLLLGTFGGLMASARAGEAVVVIEKMAFHPAELTVKVGTTVVWRNQSGGATFHTITSDQPGLFGSKEFYPDEAWRHTFKKPGEYPYHCTPHADKMKGKVVVTP